jgi:hypothetical protein
MSNAVKTASVNPIKPIPLPTGKPPVFPFNEDMLPPALSDYIFEESYRGQCPPDFIAIPAVIGLCAALGNKVKIKPKDHDQWLIVPTLWGMVVGPPGSHKSPAMKKGLYPLHRIEDELREEHKNNLAQYNIDIEVHNMNMEEAKKRAKQLVKDGRKLDAKKLLAESNEELEEPPILRRIVVNDATIEKLGVIFSENPLGVLLYRDELFGWIAKLSKEENQEERSIYLECYDGDVSKTIDRIGRGTMYIEHCTLSVIGGIQPSKLETLVRTATNGTNDDGMLQRLQLAVWPDKVKKWEYVDKPRNKDHSVAFEALFKSFYEYTPTEVNHRLTKEAQELFIDWYTTTINESLSDETPVVMQGFLAKFPKVILTIALLCELANHADSLALKKTPVMITADSFLRALMWAHYLKSHANRIYSCSLDGTAAAAALILSRRDKLPSPFKLRKIQGSNWAGLSDKDDIQAALDMLYEHNYLRAQKVESTEKGGRPTLDYFWTVE